MSISEFWECNLGDAMRFISARADQEKAKSENEWKVMRWQSALMVNMMSKNKVQPAELFTLDSETQVTQLNPNSEEAKKVFDRMDAMYRKKQQQLNG